MDDAASTEWMWDIGKRRGIHRVQEVLKARFLELMPGKGTGKRIIKQLEQEKMIVKYAMRKGTEFI